ncbi:LuxR C-terminal-related transcriptional regulator [Nocardia africana]
MNSAEWRQIIDLRDAGETISGIAARLRISRNTVRRALAFDHPPDDHRPCSGSSADTLVPEIEALLDEQPNITVAQLHRTLQWGGSRNTLARIVRRIKSESSISPSVPAALPQPPVVSKIPRFSTSFFGRRRDLDDLRAALGQYRLVTIAGPGGIGKTRLAAEAAVGFRRAFADGVRFVELASLRNDALVPQAILDALGFDDSDDPDRSAGDILVASLRDKHLLIVLDNCEHLIDACAETVAAILRGSPWVRVLVTSREILSVSDEYVHVLEPLSMTDDSHPGLPGPAIELFESRASAAGYALTDASDDAVRRVCAQLDGIPLAIELACARLNALSVEELAERLDDRLSLLTVGHRGDPDRHRSLQATVEWSYDLCTPREQMLWARLSVFAEGFDLPMAERVCTETPVQTTSVLELLGGLVDKSVLTRDVELQRVRFRMPETIRHFGASKLSDAEALQLRRAHLLACADLVDSARHSWTDARQERVSDRLRENRANLRFALQSALADGSEDAISTAAGLVATWFLWSSAFSVREHRLWVSAFLSLPAPPETLVAPLHATLGLLQTMQGDRREAEQNFDLAETCARKLDDTATLAFVFQTRGLNTYLGGNFEEGEQQLEAALRLYDTLPGGTDLMWTAHIEMGMLQSSRANVGAAAEHFELVRDQAAATGEKWMLSYSVYGSGLVALVSGNYTEAIRLALDSLTLKRAFDDIVGTTLVTDLLAWAEAAAGSGERAAVLLGAASSMWDSFGMQLYGSQHWVERRAVYEATAKASLGESAYADAHRRGAAMTMRELIDYALNESEKDGNTRQLRRPSTLSPREYQIACLVAQGLTNREIATRMVLSVRTVDGHVSNILRKLGVTRRRHVTKELLDG